MDDYILSLFSKGIIDIERMSHMEDSDVILTCPSCESSIVVPEEFLITNKKCPSCGRFV